MTKRFIDLKGKKFGKLNVIEYVYTDKYRRAIFKCKCDCGNVVYKKGSSLINEKVKSCGCLQREIAEKTMNYINLNNLRGQGNLKHGFTDTELYKHWCNMKRRCNNKNNDNYKYYGGRGIVVYPSWNNNFVEFKEWAINNGYKDGLSLERIDVNGNYEPTNCKWISFTQQIRNRRNTVRLAYMNETKPLIEWCELFNVKYKLAHERYKKGWSFEKIFGLAVGVTYLDKVTYEK